MLYVFHTANNVQIAWNAVLPAPKTPSKHRLAGLSSLVRTSSAG